MTTLSALHDNYTGDCYCCESVLLPCSDGDNNVMTPTNYSVIDIHHPNMYNAPVYVLHL